jgi:tRNA A37 threonylcarbamoyladenosine synthetase subunit TsaC/SUA5/YrdC
MSRNWHTVSTAIQKLAAALHAVESEGMFPYETHYVLATDQEVERLYN